MTRIRRGVGHLATIWLLCQIASIGGAPVVLSLASSDNAECTCTDAADGFCPMHHKRVPGYKVCVMRALTDPATVVLSSTFCVIGLIGDSPWSVVLASSTLVQPTNVKTLSSRPVPPDPPPPRA